MKSTTNRSYSALKCANLEIIFLFQLKDLTVFEDTVVLFAFDPVCSICTVFQPNLGHIQEIYNCFK